jgi:hypothetical protein
MQPFSVDRSLQANIYVLYSDSKGCAEAGLRLFNSGL